MGRYDRTPSLRHPKPEDLATASVIRWNCSIEEAKKAIETLKELGLIKTEETRLYNPDFGNPVFYVP